jgi:hypothetical protein
MAAVHVRRDAGQQGTVVQHIATDEAAPQLVIAFADGSHLVVPEDVLIAQPDGTDHGRLNQIALVKEVTKASEVDESHVVPVMAEELTSTDLVILTNDDEGRRVPASGNSPKMPPLLLGEGARCTLTTTHVSGLGETAVLPSRPVPRRKRKVTMLTDLELIVLLPLDRTTRALVWRYVAWCYATHACIPATACRVAPGWCVLVGWQ